MILGLLFYAIMIPYQNYWYLLPGIICLNSAVPFALSPLRTEVIFITKTEKRGIVSASLYLINRIAFSVNLALLTLIVVGLNNYFLNKFIHGHAKTPVTVKQLENILINPANFSKYVTQDQFIYFYHAAKNNFSLSYSIAYYIYAAIVLLVLIYTFFIFRIVKRANKEINQSGVKSEN
jgi:hypothetical protein